MAKPRCVPWICRDDYDAFRRIPSLASELPDNYVLGVEEVMPRFYTDDAAELSKNVLTTAPIPQTRRP
jgi:hypothetical protein